MYSQQSERDFRTPSYRHAYRQTARSEHAYLVFRFLSCRGLTWPGPIRQSAGAVDVLD